MKRHLGRMLFTAMLLALAGTVVVQSTALSRPARLVPLAVAVPTLVLLAWQLALDVRRVQSAAAEGEPPYQLRWLIERVRLSLFPGESPADARGPATGAELAIFAWLAMLPFLVWLLGVAPTVPLYALLYLRLQARERWSAAILMSAVIGVLPWVLARAGIVGRLYAGALWGWLDG